MERGKGCEWVDNDMMMFFVWDIFGFWLILFFQNFFNPTQLPRDNTDIELHFLKGTELIIR